MTRSISLGFTLWGPDLLAIAKPLAALRALSATPPDELTIGDRKVKPKADWAKSLERTSRTTRASWGALVEKSFSYAPPDIVSARLPDFPADPAAVIDLLAGLPFEVASFTTVHPSWFQSYSPPGFDGLQALLGWACAFRGRGHDRLVSRRWLEYGPWRLLRGPDDLSFVQFHDLAADADTALAQAKPGHQRMGITDTGGYLQDDYVYGSDVRGLYVAAERRFVIAAPGPVSQPEMRDACAMRRKRRADPKEPVEHVAYMFLTEDLAREHLHELWLRDLECWALADGQKVRRDEGYAPARHEPDWVLRLES